MTNALNWVKVPELSKPQQWAATAVAIALAGAPFTPVSHEMEMLLMALLPDNPLVAGALMFGHLCLSIVLIRLLFLKVRVPKSILNSGQEFIFFCFFKVLKPSRFNKKNP